MKDENFDRLFELAIALRDSKKINKSKSIFIKMTKTFPKSEYLYKIYIMLGSLYAEEEDYLNAKTYFIKATNLKPDSELASLGLYLSYADLKRDKQAINELDRFLSKYPAKLYRDTLKELLVGLRNGYSSNFEKTINRLSKKHGVR